jgi:hypothetical protein
MESLFVTWRTLLALSNTRIQKTAGSDQPNTNRSTSEMYAIEPELDCSERFVRTSKIRTVYARASANHASASVQDNSGPVLSPDIYIPPAVKMSKQAVLLPMSLFVSFQCNVHVKNAYIQIRRCIEHIHTARSILILASSFAQKSCGSTSTSLSAFGLTVCH